MAEKINGYFSSVFARENISSLPGAKFLEAKSYYIWQLINKYTEGLQIIWSGWNSAKATNENNIAI